MTDLGFQFSVDAAPDPPVNLLMAIDLVRSGLSVFPCDQLKRPCPGVRWRQASTTSEHDIIAWWSRWPDALPALDLAKCGLVVIDADRHGGPDGIAAWELLARGHGFNGAAHPQVETPGQGRHIYFHQPAAPLGNGRGGLPAGIDVRGHGGYVIAPGAVLADGRSYRGDDVDPELVPVMPAWLVDILRRGREHETAPQPAPAKPVATDNRRLDAYVQAALDDELAKVASAPRGTRNNALNTAAFALGQMVGAGWIGEDHARELLLEAAAQNGMLKDDGTPAALKTIASGLGAGRRQPRPEPVDQQAGSTERGAEIARRIIQTAHGDLVDAETGEVLEDAPTARAGDRDFPDELLRVPGLVGDIAEWILATSPKPIRLFATAAALAAVGTLVGRRVYSGTPRTGTNLYMICVAGTGGGKDRPQEAVKQLLGAVSAHGLYTSSVSSASALSLRIMQKPLQIQVIDEISKVLSSINGRNSSNQERALLDDYCSLWGRNLGSFIPQLTRDRGHIEIHRPWLSIFGATTPVSLIEQMRSKHVANGFLNRFLILPRHERVEWSDLVAPEDEVPAELVERCRALFGFQDRPPPGVDPRTFIPPTMGPNLMSADRPPEFIVVPTTEAADVELAQVKQHCEAMIRASDTDPLLEIWGRATEMIRRVALIVACGRHVDVGLAGATIDIGDVVYARRLVEWSVETFIRLLRENMAENEHQANLKLVLGIIRQAGQIGRDELYRRLNGRLNARDLTSIMSMLCEARQIEAATLKQASGAGRPKTLYRYLSD